MAQDQEPKHPTLSSVVADLENALTAEETASKGIATAQANVQAAEDRLASAQKAAAAASKGAATFSTNVNAAIDALIKFAESLRVT